MKLAILSRSPKAYSTKRIFEAAKQRGHQVRVLDTLAFSIYVDQEEPDLTYKNRRVQSLDAIIPRIGASITAYGTSVVRQFEQMGVFTMNSSHAITVSRDKLRSMQILSRHRIGLPATAFVRGREDVMPAIEHVGGAPVIIKLIEGTQGVGVILADHERIAAAIIETLQTARQNVLIQKFVAESKGTDIRAFVVGGEVVGAMRRRAQGQEFRSNVHRGGTTEVVELDEEYERTAVQATQILGLRVAGVDMLEGADGPQIMEVNSSPGLEGIENATGKDIAGRMIEEIEDKVQIPEVDYQQRLTLTRGYGVVEFTVQPTWDIVGKTIADAGLRDMDISVLSIIRNDLVIPNPKSTREIMSGDHMICFGKLLTLKTFVPAEKKRRRKKKKTSKKKV